MSHTRHEDVPALRIDADNEWAWCGERRLPLTPRVFAVLRYLVEHPQRLITKDDLLATIWRETAVSDTALSSCIRDLRKALGDSPKRPRYIATVHRRGFRFIGPVAGQAIVPSAAVEPDLPTDRRNGTVSPSAATPTLVGREAALARLHARLQRALAGQRQLVFVTGEPGIGKTAFAEAFLAQIGADRSLRIGRGQSVEQYGAGEPYLPVLEALGRLGREPGGEPLARVLKQHAPTWLAQLPGLMTDQDLETVLRRTRDATRDRMLREMVEALDALTLDAPLVLLLEDLHWSDSATIDLLAMLARRREASRLLVLGTYRPADAADAAHPLGRMKQELQVHGLCDEVPLDFLSVAAVGQYLSRRFPLHRFPDGLARVLHGNTDGNPLFLLNTIEYLLAQGQLGEVDGRWEVAGAVEAVAVGMPRTLQQMVEAQVERLTADQQAMLAMAAVAGTEFSSAVAGAGSIDPGDGEERCAALARNGQFLRAAGVAEWPDGTVAGRYAFIHALYQQVLYARIAGGERAALHRGTGEWLERAYGARAGEIAGELAMHFEHGRDLARAARYRRQAGENALRQHAYREVAHHATRALDLLGTLPDSPERAQQELALQVMLGTALTVTQGLEAPDLARTFARVRELCTRGSDAGHLFPVLLRLGRFYVLRGEFETARSLGGDLRAMAEATGDRAILLAAHNLLGVASFYAGEFDASLTHSEQGIELYRPEEHGPNRSAAFRLGQDIGVSCTIGVASTLWILGYPARAASRMEEALALARSLAHPFSLAYACHFAAGFHQWRRERQAVQDLEAAAAALDTEHGFELFRTTGAFHRGWLLAERGRVEEGLALMRQELATRRDRPGVVVPAFLGMVAELHGKLGQPAEGLSRVGEALAAVRHSGHHYWDAELVRLRGAFTLQAGSGPAAARDAESCFVEAIEIARRQRAKSLELRAAMSLSRLWASRGEAAKARALLMDIYHWFTEGFDTADLGEAKALLEDLEHRIVGKTSRG